MRGKGSPRRVYIHSQVLVYLPAFAVLSQQPPQHSHSPQPHNLGRHASLRGTLTLSVAGVTSEALGSKGVTCTGTGVDDGGLDDAVSRRGHESVELL